MDFLQRIKKEVNKFDSEAEVILFGSRARGDHRPESDWDLLILLSSEKDLKRKQELQDRLYELEVETEQVISSLIHTRSDWEKRKVTPLYQIIAQEGRRA